MNDIVSEPTKEEARAQFDHWTKVLGLKHTFSFDEAYEFCLAKRKREEFQKNIVDFEKHFSSLPGVKGQDPYPLKHEFADGVYIRTITVPAGELTVTKIHAQTHPFFLMKGTVTILTEEGPKVFSAPYAGITKAGTKRVIYHHDEVVLTTVHRTDETDLAKIEAEVIARDYKDLEQKLLSKREVLCLG